MLFVLKNSWALLLGLMLLMIGNGLQGTVLGLRGSIEGYSAATMSYVMSGYFVGFLLGSRLAPLMIRRVGHVRVFAALASLISAAFLIYAAAPHPVVWAAMRLLVGLCFSGVYVVTESWLNDKATNETRGQALSLYLIVQMVGIISAQAIANFADAGGYMLFVIMSVLVSIAFAPILLSASPAPVFQTTKPMSLIELYHASPLGVVSTFLLGGVFAGMFGMASVFGTEAGLSVPEVTLFISMFYVGGMALQFPLGWVSDRMDRRWLIFGTTVFAVISMLMALPFIGYSSTLLVLAFIIGGCANPLYSLVIAYTNDFLESDDMAAASGGLLFVNGLGAISGPLVIGWAMNYFGPYAYFGYIALLFALIAAYAAYRMTQRPAPNVEDTATYTAILPQASPVAMEVAQNYAADQARSDDDVTHDIPERKSDFPAR
ncbi:MFS transporter [Algicella marina]|uniref:MFS transporter n=1 Tax=Algicella marina TaxID=2683284 RepID=A0A6P1T050_9RHOB|nr:MFS transporter [Algicella marina]QHQ34659.1 MFS transporter [Algicella marina]